VRAVQHLSKPAIHYKVLAAGRNDPQEAFAFVARYLRSQDGVCVGVYSKHNPNMLREDLELLESSIAAA
jgi:inorganic triphosphatase YgiF